MGRSLYQVTDLRNLTLEEEYEKENKNINYVGSPFKYLFYGNLVN